jgi:hypothetical protein
MTIKEEVAVELGTCVFTRDHVFLANWLKDAGDELWVSIAPDLCSRFVNGARRALGQAFSDHKAGADSWVHLHERERKRLREVLAHVKALHDHYRNDYGKVHWELCNDVCGNVEVAEAELSRLSDNLAWCEREGKALFAKVSRPLPNPAVNVSRNKVAPHKKVGKKIGGKGGKQEGKRGGAKIVPDRVKWLFYQRLAKGVMKPLLGKPNEARIAKLATYAFNAINPEDSDLVVIDPTEVHNALKKMPKT